jgi:hypothetical protein
MPSGEKNGVSSLSEENGNCIGFVHTPFSKVVCQSFCFSFPILRVKTAVLPSGVKQISNSLALSVEITPSANFLGVETILSEYFKGPSFSLSVLQAPKIRNRKSTMFFLFNLLWLLFHKMTYTYHYPLAYHNIGTPIQIRIIPRRGCSSVTLHTTRYSRRFLLSLRV